MRKVRNQTRSLSEQTKWLNFSCVLFLPISTRIVRTDLIYRYNHEMSQYLQIILIVSSENLNVACL